MIAQVYPVLRLPRRFDVFDYRIPKSLTIKAGDLVTIPFRGKQVLGIVQAVVKTSTILRLATITSRTLPAFYKKKDLERIRSIASALITTPSQLYYFLLHDFSPVDPSGTLHRLAQLKLTLNKQDAEVITRTLKNPLADFAQLSLEGQIALAYRATKLGTTLIIAPNPKLAERVGQILGIPCLASKTPRATKRELITRWYRKELHALVATRIGSLLPANDAQFVIVLESTSDDYEYLERNPRFLAPLASTLFMNHKIRVIHTDTFPSLLSTNPVLQSSPPVRVINLKEGGLKTPHPLLSETVLTQTKVALQSGKTVLYLLNRNQEMDAEKSSTTVLSTLRSYFGETVVGELSEKNHALDRPLLLATDYAFKHLFEPFRKYVDLVVDLFPDLALQDTAITSTEDRVRRLYQITSFARAQNAPCLIQSFQPSYYLSMLETDAFLTTLRETRLRYKQHPFSRRYTVSPNIDIPFPMEREADKTIITIQSDQEQALRATLATLDDSFIIESYLPTYDTPTRTS